MAISSFDEIWPNSRLRENAEGALQERYYRAISDSPELDTLVTVRNDSRCPRFGDVIDGYAVESVEITRQATSRIEYIVRVTLSEVPIDGDGGSGGGGGGNNLPDDPINDPPVFEADSNLQYLPFEKDLNNKLCVNAAGDMFDPLPQRLTSFTSVVVSRFERFFGLPVLRNYAGKINSRDFLGFPPETLLCRISFRTTLIERKKIRYNGYNVTYRFDYNPLGWQTEALNKGFNSTEGVDRVGNPLSKRPIKINGEDAKTPQLLDAQGRWIPTNTAEEALDAANYISLRAYYEIDFNELNIQEPQGI